MNTNKLNGLSEKQTWILLKGLHNLPRNESSDEDFEYLTGQLESILEYHADCKKKRDQVNPFTMDDVPF